ncbi:hypothetical protein, partial [Yersinia mollaretii]|uniref:hypothetical protein n=1 Tax=Yersinia mollaretii TaxID=33060 RepID=UPI001E33E583
GAVASDVQLRFAGCPSPGTLFKETSLTAGFLLSGVWTLHRTPFDYSPCKQDSPLWGRRLTAVEAQDVTVNTTATV